MTAPPGPDEAERLAEELSVVGAALARQREAARRSDQRLSLALQAFESVVWELSFHERRLFLTGAVADVFDAPPTFKAMVEDVHYACHPLDRERIGALWKAHIDEGRPFRAEHRIRRADGREVWVEAAAEVLRDEHGQPQRVIGVLKNITDSKLDQIAVAEAREAAEQANRAKTEFLANISHELRTPLNGVLGIAGALGATQLDADQIEMVRLIESSAQGLEQLLADLLDLARIESGALEIRRETFDLGRLIRETAALFEPLANDKGVAFFLEISPSCAGWCVGDPVRLRQILSNLLSNAVKYTDQGAIKVEAELEPGEARAHRLRLSVSDTGMGFDPAEAARLFGRFEQGDASATRRHGGAGLGLSIARSLATRMGGGLEAESEPGRGATFALHVELESARPPARLAGPVGTLVAASGAAPRILLAEDHPANRKVAELILTSAGAEVSHAADGAEAVVLAETGGFDLILMDMQMPVMDGLAAIRAIREREAREGAPPIPILMLTANAMAEHDRAAREAGADGHITKPVSAKTLLESVAHALAAMPAVSACSAANG